MKWTVCSARECDFIFIHTHRERRRILCARTHVWKCFTFPLASSICVRVMCSVCLHVHSFPPIHTNDGQQKWKYVRGNSHYWHLNWKRTNNNLKKKNRQQTNMFIVYGYLLESFAYFAFGPGMHTTFNV